MKKMCYNPRTLFSMMIRKPDFAKNLENKGQISNAVTAQLITNFDFATLVVQSLLVLNPKCLSHLLLLNRLFCVGLVGVPKTSPLFFLSFFCSFLLGSLSLFELYDLSMTN